VALDMVGSTSLLVEGKSMLGIIYLLFIDVVVVIVLLRKNCTVGLCGML
jgi:hypothetical protein